MTGILTKSSIATYLAGNLGFVTTAASSVYLISLDGFMRVLGVIGLFLGLYMNWYFKRRADKRAEELHHKEMKTRKEN